MFYTQQSFNGGEITPWLDSRFDFKKYASSARRIENFVATPYGPLRRRCGTEFIVDSPARARLLPFQRTSDDSYIIELCKCTLRVLSNGAVDAFFVAPWNDDEIDEVQILKLNNIMLFTQRNNPPQVLRYVSDGNWSFNPVGFDHPPFLDAPLDDTTMQVTPDSTSSSTSTTTWSVTTYSATEHYSGTVPIFGAWEVDVSNYTLHSSHHYLKLQRSTDGGLTWTDVQTFSADGNYTGVAASGILRLAAKDAEFDAILTSTNDVDSLSAGDAVTVTHSALSGVFDASMVGSEIKVNHIPDSTETKLGLMASGTSGWMTIQGNYTLTTSGNWKGRLYLEKSTDNGVTVEPVIDRSATADRNITYQGESNEKALFRLRFVMSDTGSNDPHAYLEGDGSTIQGRILINNFVSDTEVEGVVIEGVYSQDSTDDWQLAAWSDYYGWPAAITWHEGRVIYGGTNYAPDTFWLSKSDDYYNFKRGTNDDDSFQVTIGSEVLSEIVYLASQDGLVCGTSGDAWIGKSYSDSGVITPSSLVMRRISDVGSARIQPVFTTSGIVHVQREQRSLIQIGYNASSASESGYAPTNLNILNPTITKSGIRCVAKQQAKESVIWATTENGSLVALSYDASQDVYGWHSHPMTASVGSVAIIYEGNDEDSIYISTSRDGRHYIERFYINQYELLEDGDAEDSRFLDCHTYLQGDVPATTFDELYHLDGLTVDVVADGAYLPNLPIVNATLQLEIAASNVLVGLPYTSLLETLPAQANLKDGSSLGRIKKTLEAYINVYRSVTAEVACTGSGGYKWQKLKQSWRKSNDVGVEETANALGNLETWKIPVISGHDRDARIAVKCDQPVPLNIMAINQKLELSSE